MIVIVIVDRSNDLKTHIKFLESLGIGGVSHHSLLFSKSEPEPDVHVEEDVRRLGAELFMVLCNVLICVEAVTVNCSHWHGVSL